MRPGDVIDGRFLVQHMAGSGGVGTVYCAKDRVSGELAAVKVLAISPADEGGNRFRHEAELLRKLSHPAIVRYVHHGVTEAGAPYLAMEWLEGQDLEARLAESGLSLQQTVDLARRVADALAFAHAHGVVHRDIKPSNLFLPGGRVDSAKMLDFGVARLGHGFRSISLTGDGALVGTPKYMAPEQARGERLDLRADLFSLGCVLYECLSGKPPFSGEHVMAVLAKILLEDPQPLLEAAPHVPLELEEIVTRLLKKSPAERPSDANEVLRSLDKLKDLEQYSLDRITVPGPPPSLTGNEQVLCSVVLASVGKASDTEATLPAEKDGRAIERPATAVDRFGGRLEWLADGSAIVLLTGSGAATDRAAQAARCSLALAEALPGARIVLATGKGERILGRLPVGDVIERAVAILRHTRAARDVPADEQQPVRLDAVTAGLLDERFEVHADDAGRMLLGERRWSVEPRTLLGKSTPTVGRRRELALLTGLYEECVSESIANGAVVIGGAGMGKSRLRYEFVRKLDESGEPVELWTARGDPMSAGSVFGLLGQALRRAAGVFEGELLEVRREKLRARVARNVHPADAARVAAFLGELVGTPFPETTSVQLRAARQDPILLGDQMLRAFEDYVRAECRTQPVVLILEDLQWGDHSTVRFVDSALRHLAEERFIVVAFARPEVRELFPSLWIERGVQQIHLGRLSRRASERLVREVLPDTAPDTVERVAERAAGNAFYLEELIRAVAFGWEDGLPETVLAMVQARLEALEPEARQVLRAASVFGRVFWRDAVTALIGGPERGGEVDRQLSVLVDAELIARRGEPRFVGEEEYTFRHELVREAAYASLTKNDRVLGHRLAAEWLEAAGEQDAATLAEHHERGGRPQRGLPWYRRAAEQARDGNDLAAALRFADRGIACGAEKEELGSLRLVQAEAHGWRGEYPDARDCAHAAMKFLKPGSAAWYAAAVEAASACGKIGEVDQLVWLARTLLETEPGEASEQGRAMAYARIAANLIVAGRAEPARAVMEKFDAVPDISPLVSAWRSHARGVQSLVEGDPGAFLEHCHGALSSFEQAGDLRLAALVGTNIGFALVELGAAADAEQALRDTIALAERLGLPPVAAAARHTLGLALLRLDRLPEAREVESRAMADFAVLGDARLENGCRVYLAAILLAAGDLDAAESEARIASRAANVPEPTRVFAMGMLARTLLARGRAEEALQVTGLAMSKLESVGGLEEGEALVRLVHAEALKAAGRGAEASRAASLARDRLLERADRIRDVRWRASFLQSVPENAATLALAGESGTGSGTGARP